MLKNTSKLSLTKILATLCVLFLAAQVGASPATVAGTGDVEAPAVVVVDGVAASEMTAEPIEEDVVATEGEVKAAATFTDLVATPEWQTGTGGYCQYTCPQGMVQLCPDFLGASKSCVNNCCVYQ